jgi:hypothetical protein
LEGIKDRISSRLKDTNFPGLIDNETTSSRIEDTYNTSETDNLRTKSAGESNYGNSLPEPKTDLVVFFINENQLAKCPEVEIRIKNGITLRTIIDSGSEVNLISEKAFEQLRKTQHDILILPIENVRLVTAFGRRSKKIKSQILMEFTLGEDEFEGVFMISSQLTNDAIIGCQLLREYNMNINFEKE